MTKKLLFFLFMFFSAMNFAPFLKAENKQDFHNRVELLLNAVRSKLLLENIGSDTQALLKQLDLAIPRLRCEAKRRAKKAGEFSEARILLLEIQGEFQAFEFIKEESKDVSYALLRKQMLWKRLLRAFIYLEQEAQNSLLSSSFVEGKKFFLTIIEEVSQLDLQKGEVEGLYYISDSLSRWEEKAKKEQENLQYEAELKRTGFPPMPKLRRQNAYIPPLRRPDSLCEGYIPEK